MGAKQLNQIKSILDLSKDNFYLDIRYSLGLANPIQSPLPPQALGSPIRIG